MKCLYVCPTPMMYGDNIALLKLMPNLINYGVKPYFIVYRKGAFTDELDKRGLSYQIFNDVYPTCYYSLLTNSRGFFSFWIRYFIGYNKSKYEKLLSSIKLFDPDLIHTNNSYSQLGYRISIDIQKKHVWHIREYGKLDADWHYFPSKKSFLAKIGNKNNYSVFITDHIREYFQNPSNGCTVYDGVFDQDPPEICLEKLNYFLFVGRLNKVKGIKEVVQSFIEYNNCLSESQNELWIAGDGNPNFISRIKRIVKRSGFSHKIKFLGYRRDIFELMRNAKALIVSSRYEAFGFITAEAMFNGCLVIGKNTGGTKMQLDNGLNYMGYEVGFRYNTIDELTGLFVKADMIDKDLQKSMLFGAQLTTNTLYRTVVSSKNIWTLYQQINIEAK